jgi:hypothetical protein
MENDNAPIDIRQVWTDICLKLSDQISLENLERWVKPLLPRYVTKEKICLATTDEFQRQWVLDHYQDQITDAAETILAYSVTLEIFVTGQLSLPSISKRQAIIPNSFARSALFGVQARGQSDYLEQVELESWKNVQMKYTGPQLDQHDLDVWLQCLRFIDSDELGKPVEFSAYGFLKEMGKGTSKRDYQNMNRRLTRLKATAVDVQIGEEGYVGSLIERYYRHEGTGRFVIIVDPLIASLFKNDQYSRLDWEQRIQLRGQLTKFLHAYLPTHSTKKAPHFIGVEKLLKLSKSSTKRLGDFRKMLRKSCLELDKVGALKDWWIDENDVAHFIRANSPQIKNDTPSSS